MCQCVLELLSQKWDSGHERGGVSYTYYRRDLLILCSRTYNVHQVLLILEGDSIFEEASDYIEPPPVNEDSDEDSEEEEGEGTFSSLNGRQQGAASTATVLGQGQLHPFYEPESASDETVSRLEIILLSVGG